MNRPTLLLIDDEERILRSLRMLFISGYNVRTTTDPQEAIAILRNERVHVIVSDQRMPQMQGSELLHIACETSPATMRILLTGYSDLNASISSVNEGEVFRYLLKPWVGDEVKQVVAEAAAIAEASFAMQQSHPEIAFSAPSEKPRVLIMDDDENTARAVHEILKDRCEIIWAADAQHAMEELAKEDVSVVVSDLMLGDTNVGYILKTIKQINPRTQCIVVTSFKETAHLIELINQAQITRYLPKPLNQHILERSLETMLDRFHRLCRMPELQKRQSVAPISDPHEKQLSVNFTGLLSRLRAYVGAT